MESRRATRVIWPIALFLITVGLILVPMHLRVPILSAVPWMKRLAYANFLLAAAVILLMAVKRNYNVGEIILSVLWLLLLVPIIISDFGNSPKEIAAVLINQWIPLFLIYQKMDKEHARRWTAVMLVLFDVFILVLLGMALFEKATGAAFLKTVVDWYAARGFKASELKRYLDMFGRESFRYYSIWGHPLTNGYLFNAFYILNDIFFRRQKKQYPKLLFVLIAMLGVLLCGGKTAIVILGVYLVLSSLTQPGWLVAYAAGGLVLYLMGYFDKIIERFTHGSLTSGRWEALVGYWNSGVFPLKWFWGYGTNTVLQKEAAVYDNAFEFPVLAFALDYGILFSGILLVSVFLYLTVRCLRKKQVVAWIGISFLLVQLNVYNGMSMYRQDIFWMAAVMIMLALNCIEPEPEEKHGRKKYGRHRNTLWRCYFPKD